MSASRRLLFHAPLYNPHSAAAAVLSAPSASDPNSDEPSAAPGSSFDANVLLILAVLLCALLGALGLNSVVRCALRCSNRPGLGYQPRRVDARLGSAGGDRRKALRDLPVLVYSAGLKLHGSGSECAICLSDLAPGERIRVLPKCTHGFHAACIDRWLIARPSCPTCRQCFPTTPQKSSTAGGELNRLDPVRSILLPLEPERLIDSHSHSLSHKP